MCVRARESVWVCARTCGRVCVHKCVRAGGVRVCIGILAAVALAELEDNP
jgi:hypothetical protein